MTHARHVILGAGTAGVTAAETLRQLVPDDDILLIDDELGRLQTGADLPEWIAGVGSEDAIPLKLKLSQLTRQNIRLHNGRATRLQLTRHASFVALQDGRCVPFDKLLIATGARARPPAIAGVTSHGVHPCWTRKDAAYILQAIRPAIKILLIGASLIAMRWLDALLPYGVDLTVVEQHPSLLSSYLPTSAGELVRRYCEMQGIQVRTGARVTAIKNLDGRHDQSPLIVRLASGEQLRAGLVLCCTGVSPRIDFLERSGVRCDTGVLVGQSMQTNHPDIYAAGDCAQSWDADLGNHVISGTQSNAADQGYCAALNMVGERAFQTSPRRLEEFNALGLACSSLGRWQGVPGGQWVEYRDTRRNRFLRLEFNGGTLIGCSAVGMREHAAVAKQLIQQRPHLGSWLQRLLAEPLRLQEAWHACAESCYTDRGSLFAHRGVRSSGRGSLHVFA